MTVLGRYAVWNNKGGVGKSTITFHLASRYAEKHPRQRVLVIDLCPQSNVSMLLLGGGSAGENAVLKLCTAATPKTVVGYLSSVIAGGARAPVVHPNQFLVHVNDENENIADNLYLLCGDGNLEPMSPAITNAANSPALTPQVQPWKWVHLVFRDFIKNTAERITPETDWVVFIDTNPSFAIYTELAISAADRLITPVNADDSSRVATNAMFILLHGQTPPHPIYGAWTYAAQAQRHNIAVPKIHVIVGNRLTQGGGGTAAAFEALSDATADTLFQAYQSHGTYFTPRSTNISNRKQFRRAYSVPLRDFNTAGVVSAHLGCPLSKLDGGYHQVQGEDVQVNVERVRECEKALDDVLAFI